MFNPRSLATRTIAIAAISVVALAGCSKSEDKDSKDAATTTSVATSTAKATVTSTAKATDTETATTTVKKEAAALSAENFHLHDGFVKAVPADKKMTAVFGVLENHTDAPVHLVGFTTSLKAKMNQIHEVVNGKMQEKEGGIVIEPHSKHVLKPGGDHLMIMGLEQAVEAGSTINVTLKFEDGSTVEIKDVPARALGAGNESYGDMDMDHKDGGMTMENKESEQK